MKTIDNVNLVAKADALANDGKLNMAEKAVIHIQELELEDGSIYNIELVATIIKYGSEFCNCESWHGTEIDQNGHSKCSFCKKEKVY